MKTQLKNILAIALLTGSALFMTACASSGGSSGSTAATSVGGTKPYPLKTCIVTENDLGSMGDEQSIVYQGQEIKFCCKPCEAKFLGNPAKYLARIR